MEPTKPVGIWIRVSTEDQAKGESPEHHQVRARQYAESRGWEIVTVYHLEGVSGKSVMGHPEAKRMMEDVRAGRITGLVFSKIARLARNTKELLEFSEFFRQHGADLVSLQESIDTSTPSGRMFFTMNAAAAQWEREEIASRVSASVSVRASLGKPLGGQASFGYRWDKKTNRLEIDEKEAPVRRMVYELFLASRRKKSTAAALNAMGYRTRNGSKFSDTTVDRLIRDTTAKGVHRANYTKSTGDRRKWVEKPKEEWVMNPCPAIVEEEVWNECNRILDDNLEKRRKVGPRAKHLLAGFVRCSCGKKMYVFYGNGVYACKPCKRRIPAADLDEIFSEQLKTFLVDESDVETYLAKAGEAAAERSALITSLNAELEKSRKRMSELVEMRLDKELSKDSFVAQHKPLEERESQMRAELERLEREVAEIRKASKSSETVIREAKSLYDRWPGMGFDERLAMVETITRSITVSEDEISIRLAYIPAPLKMAENSNATSWVHTGH